MILVAGLTVSAGAATKLAVWGTPDQRDATAALITELSGIPEEYVVLEREQLEKAVAEPVLQSQGLSLEKATKTGGLLGAEGVLWTESAEFQGRRVVVTRLCATGSGVVVGWQVDDAPLPDLIGWSKLMATRINGWRAKLGIARDRAVPISFLDLRSATDSLVAGATGQTLKTLLGARLTAQPELFILERWRMDDLAWENVLSGAASHEFWNGAWLLDGSITTVAGEVELNMRLRAADGREVRWTRRGKDKELDGLVTAIATDVLQRLPAGSPPVAWDSKAEAREFLAEAEWASRWKLEARALEASEAAIALGMDSLAVQRLRYLSYSRLAVSGPRGVIADAGLVNGWSRSSPLSFLMPDMMRIEYTEHAFVLFSDLRRSALGVDLAEIPRFGAGPNESGFYDAGRSITPAERDASELLRNAARILWTAYFAKSDGKADSTAVLARLRFDARSLFEHEFTALAFDFHARDPDRLPPLASGGRGYPVQLHTLPLVGFALGALWAERATDHEALTKKLLGNQVGGSNELYENLIDTLSPQRWDGWSVDWATHDNRLAHDHWEQFVRNLLKERDLGLQVAGAIWLLSLHDFDQFDPRKVEVISKNAETAWTTLGSHLAQLADGRLPRYYLIQAISRTDRFMSSSTCDDLVERLASQFAHPGLVPGPLAWLVTALPLQPKHKERLRVILEQKIATPGLEAPWVAQDRDAVLKCFRYLEVEMPTSLASADALPKAIKPSVRQAVVNVKAAWIIADPDAATRHWSAISPYRGIRWAALIDERLWLITSFLKDYHTPPVYTLGVIDLPGLQTREVFSWRAQTFEDMEWEYDFPSFALLNGWVYSWEKRGLYRRRIKDGREEAVPLPINERPKLWAVNGWLYLGLASGGVLRVDPKNNAWELIADSRRRPAQGPLDDCAAYKVSRIWQDAHRGLCVMKEDQMDIYALNADRRTWSVLKDWASFNRGSYSSNMRRVGLESLNNVEFASLGYTNSIIANLLWDVDRRGHSLGGFEAGTYFGGDPPVIKPGARLARWSLIGGMAEGNDVWALFHHEMELQRMPHLVWIPEPPTETVAIELKLPPSAWEELMRDQRKARDARNGFFGERALMIPSRHGLAIYAVGSPVLWFIPQKELEAAGVGRSPSQ